MKAVLIFASLLLIARVVLSADRGDVGPANAPADTMLASADSTIATDQPPNMTARTQFRRLLQAMIVFALLALAIGLAIDPHVLG